VSAAGLPHKLPQPEGTDNGRLEKKKKKKKENKQGLTLCVREKRVITNDTYCQPMSLSPGAVLRYAVIGFVCQSALEPWQLGGQAIQYQ
jgi:hypothetical protein